MLSVPAAIACARAGDLANAQRHLEHGRAVGGAVAGHVVGGGDRRGAGGGRRRRAATRTRARQRMQSAAEQFERAGQPLDAERCRRLAAECESVPRALAHR